MSAPTWEQIIDAVIVGDARIGPYIAQQIVKADNRAQSVFPDTISPTMPRPMFSVSETPPDVETDDMDVLRAGDPDWEDDDDDFIPDSDRLMYLIQDVGETEAYQIMREEIYGAKYGCPDDETEAENAAIEDDGQTNAGILSDGGGGPVVSVMSVDDDMAHESALVPVEIAALSVMDAETVPPTSETTPPRESDGQQPVSVRRPKGLTKLRAKVWEWIDQNAGDDHNTDTLSVNKVKAGAGCARGVAGEVLSLYRSWYTDTSRKDKAS